MIKHNTIRSTSTIPLQRGTKGEVNSPIPLFTKLSIILLLLLPGCGQHPGSSADGTSGIDDLGIVLGARDAMGHPRDSAIDQMLATAPIAAHYTCAYETAFMHSYGDWRQPGLTKVYYTLDTMPAGVDSIDVLRVIRSIMNDMEEQSGIPTRYLMPGEQKPPLDGLITISLRRLDGIGGKWGDSEFPPTDASDRRSIHLLLDLYDYFANRRDYYFITAAMHEAGHSFGLRHSSDPQSVMYDCVNKEKKNLHMDDVLGLRTLYRRYGDFTYEDTRYIAIKKGGTRQLRRSFNEREFWTTCQNYTQPVIWIAAPVIDGLQIIRDHIGVGMRFTSGYRGYLCNLMKGSTATRSYHILSRAGDYVFIGTPSVVGGARYRYEKDFQKKGPLFQKLILAGVSGFGSYPNNSYHIDCRRADYTNIWNGSSYAAWGRFSSRLGWMIPEDGTHD